MSARIEVNGTGDTMEWTVEDPADHIVVTTRGVFNVAEHRRMLEDIVSRDPEEALVWLLRDE